MYCAWGQCPTFPTLVTALMMRERKKLESEIWYQGSALKVVEPI
jgi:hypothetical protein